MILLMVLATATPNPKAAIKLKNAANATAFLGERTFVETTVDMEFAASWKPFVKSKMSARTMMPTMRSRVRSSMVPGGYWLFCRGIAFHDVKYRHI